VINKYLQRGLPLREARIYAMIDIVDQNLGRLLQTLDERDLTDDTVVVFMTDNGGVSKHYQAGLRGNKASIYEGGVRVPLFVRWPGHFPAGGRVQAQCSHVDLFPTFCALAGADVPTDRPLDGKSLLPLLQAGSGQRHQEYVYHTWDRYRPNPDDRWSISDQRWKLACQVSAKQSAKQDKWQLFDLEQDPGESQNLAKQHPEIVRRLRAEFVRWFQEVTAGQDFRPVPIPVGHRDEPDVEIQPSWAEWHGENIAYVFRGYDWDTIEGWRAPGEHATWQLDVLRDGLFDVDISYGRSPQDGGTLRISTGEQSLECDPPPTPTADVFQRHHLGRFSLPAGPAVLKAEVVRAEGEELMRLNGIHLRRVSDDERRLPDHP
jgi:hypothetical protein